MQSSVDKLLLSQPLTDGMECKAFETKRAVQVDFARLRRCLDLAAW